MDAQKNKAFFKTIRCFLLFLILRLVEELVVVPKFANTMGLISCVGGFFILLGYIRFDDKPLEKIGVLFSGHKVHKGFGLAVVLNLIPMVVVYGLELFRFRSMPGSTHLTVYYDKIDHAYSVAGRSDFLMWLAIGLAVSLIHAVFYEMCFRGLLVTLASKSLSFGKVNAIQTVLYTLWFLVPTARVLLTQFSQFAVRDLLILVGFTVAYEILTGIKLGLLRYSTGAVWVCIFDHLAFSYITELIHVQYSVGTASVTDAAYYVRMLGYQALSLLITLLYYAKKRKKIEAQKQEALLRK